MQKKSLVDLIICNILDSEYIQKKLASVKKSHLSTNYNLQHILESYAAMAIYHVLKQQGVKNVAAALKNNASNTLDKVAQALDRKTLLNICAQKDFELSDRQLSPLMQALAKAKHKYDCTVDYLCEKEDYTNFASFKDSQHLKSLEAYGTNADDVFKINGKFSYFYSPQETFNHGEVLLKFVDFSTIANLAIAYRIKFALPFIANNNESLLDEYLAGDILRFWIFIRDQAASALDDYLQECQGQSDNLIARLKTWTRFKYTLREYLSGTCNFVKTISETYKSNNVGLFSRTMTEPFLELFNAAQYCENIEHAFAFEDTMITAQYFNIKLPKDYAYSILNEKVFSHLDFAGYYVRRLAALFAPTFEHEQDISYAAFDMEQAINTVKQKLNFMFEGHLPEITSEKQVSFDKLHLLQAQFLLNLYIQGLSTKFLAEQSHRAQNNHESTEISCWFPITDQNPTFSAAFDAFMEAYNDKPIQQLLADFKRLEKAYSKLEMVSYSEGEKISEQEKRSLDKFILKAQLSFYQEMQCFLESLGVLISDANLSLSNSANDSSRNYNESLKEIYKYLCSYNCYFLTKHNSWSEKHFNGFSSEDEYRKFLPQLDAIFAVDLKWHIISLWQVYKPLRSIVFSAESFCERQQFEYNLRTLKNFNVSISILSSTNFAFLLRAVDPKEAPQLPKLNFHQVLHLAPLQNIIFEWLIKYCHEQLSNALKAMLGCFAKDIYTAKTQKAVKPYLSDLFIFKQMLKDLSSINLNKFNGILEANFQVMLTDSIVKHPDMQAFLEQLLATLKSMSHKYDELSLEFKEFFDHYQGFNFASYLSRLIAGAKKDLLSMLKFLDLSDVADGDFDACTEWGLYNRNMSLNLMEHVFDGMFLYVKQDRYDYVDFTNSIVGNELASLLDFDDSSNYFDEDNFNMGFPFGNFLFGRRHFSLAPKLKCSNKIMTFIDTQLKQMEQEAQAAAEQPIEESISSPSLALFPSKSSATRSRRTQKPIEEDKAAAAQADAKSKSQAPSEDQPKPKRTRRTKAQIEADKAAAAAAAQADAKSKAQAPSEEAPKPKRTRRTKAQIEADKAAAAAAQTDPKAQAKSEEAPKPKRTRRTKAQIEADKAAAAATAQAEAKSKAQAPSEDQPKPKRTRRTKA